jgi:dienelactone hydrolase
MDVLMSVDADRVLHGLRFAPPSAEKWTPPGYANERRFTEEEITLGSGDESVPGTLTLPRGPLLGRALGRRAPAVVLLAGGGPFDRDESSGPNKPLKDLAWGLATHGIAVLRFDKATVVHAEAMNERGYTLTQEYVPHAVAAVRLLQRHRAVDPKRVFVLGHSAGGKAVPRVAAAESSVAGLILLAADAAPMHETAVRVAQHIAAMEPGPDADAAVAELTALAERAADPGLDTNVPASQLPFGLPAAYWLDLRGYDAVAVAAAAGRPMFIAQGGRDYQVTVEHDFALRREDVHCRVYEADDHLFFPGTDPSTPASYRAPQHVDPALVADVAEWIKAR